MQHLIFAFGMNLDPRCMFDGCHEVGPAVLRDWELEFRCFANVKPAQGKKVLGALWSLDARALSDIDYREGYRGKGNITNLYDRLTVKVDNGDEQVDAFVYVMGKRTLHEGPPSTHYLELILNGYTHFGLDDEYLWDAVRKSCTSAAHFDELYELTLRYWRKEVETHG